jgi:putative ABC transport system permease protein
MIPLRYNARSLFVRKATTLATAFGIALVVFVLAASRMLANGITETMGRSGDAARAIVMRKGADAELSGVAEQRHVGLVLAGPGVRRNAQGVAIGGGEALVVLALPRVTDATQISNVQLRGVNPNVFELRPEARIVAGRPARPGTDEAMIGARLRGKFTGLELGQRFEINKNRMAEVVGVFEAAGSSFESEIWADLETVRTSFGRDGLVSSITVALESPSAFDRFRAAIEGDKQLDLQVLSEPAYFEKVSEGTALLMEFLGGAIVFFLSLGAMIGATITMYGAVDGRKREIGTLRALGFTRLQVLGSFLFESALLAVLGGAVGAVAALGMGFVKISMMNQSTWSEMVFSFDPTPDIVVGSVVAGALMGIAGGFLPAARAARVSPIAAMRE